MSTRGTRTPTHDGAPDATSDDWLADGQIRTYRRGQKIIEAGTPLAEWIAISGGAAFLAAKVAADTRVAVAALWLGDVSLRTALRGIRTFLEQQTRRVRGIPSPPRTA